MEDIQHTSQHIRGIIQPPAHLEENDKAGITQDDTETSPLQLARKKESEEILNLLQQVTQKKSSGFSWFTP